MICKNPHRDVWVRLIVTFADKIKSYLLVYYKRPGGVVGVHEKGH